MNYPEKVAAHLWKGLELYAKEDQHVEASIEFEEALRLNPRDPQCHFWVAKMMAEFGDNEDAVELFDNAVKMSPDNAQYHFEKGDILALWGCFDEALNEMTKAIRLNPKNANYHYFKGLAHNSMRDYEKALKEFDSCLGLLPDCSEFHLAKMDTLVQLGRTVEGTEEQNKVHIVTENDERHPMRYEGILEIKQAYFFQKFR